MRNTTMRRYRFGAVCGLVAMFVSLLAVASPASAAPVGTTCPPVMHLGNLGSGVAAKDNATGTGYLMWSSSNVRVRFSTHRGNAEHLVAVVFDGSTWKMDNNGRYVAFTPAADDCLVGELDFGNDTANVPASSATMIGGIDYTYARTTLVVTPNMWGTSFNAGEWGVAGTTIGSLSVCPELMELGDLGNGVAGRDGATGTGYLMWSSTDVRTRFAQHRGNAEHLIAVFYDASTSTWQADRNVYRPQPFTPAPDDCLVAELDFTNDTANVPPSSATVINGIDSTYSSTTLEITPNMWGNKFNLGEWGVAGTTIGGGPPILVR